MKSIVENGIDWLWNHKPDIALAGTLIALAIAITSVITDFQHRLASTERLCNDINERQLPEIREEIREMRVDIREVKDELRDVKTDIVGMKEELVEIKLFIKKIDTYLATKDKNYPRP